jgi:hypothetical protein
MPRNGCKQVITLGGYDEERLWAAWRDYQVLPNATVAHLYIPQLSEPDSEARDPLYMGRTSLAWASKEDIEHSLRDDISATGGHSPLDPDRMSKWLLAGTAMLPSFITGQSVEFRVGNNTVREGGDLDRCNLAALPACLADVTAEWLFK